MNVTPITVGIVEDDAEICGDLEQIIAATSEFRCVCSCRNAQSALAEIPVARPDLAIMDISLPDGTGIQCTHLLKRRMPDLQILMFTVHEDSDQIFQALAAGANGYILKRSRSEDFLNALRELAHGGVPMSAEIARKVIASFRRKPERQNPAVELTPREEAVLQKLAEGLSDKEISTALSISPGTVNTHLKHIYSKLHVRSRTEAVIEYLR